MMIRRTSLLLLLSIFVSSCSMSMEEIFLIPTQTATPSRTITVTATQAPTITATIPTPTYTSTPTLIGQKTHTLTLEPSATIEPSETPVPPTPTATVEMQGFVTVFTSKTEFFKKGICEPVSVKFTAQVANAQQVSFVVLFVRFRSRQTGATSEWTSITMQVLTPGTYTHDLVAEEMKGVDFFRNSWVEYQLVSTNGKLSEVGRTDIFRERLSVLDCVPTPTLTPGPETSTPTP